MSGASMWSLKADVAKASALLLLLFFCGYTSLNKFVLKPLATAMERSESSKLKAEQVLEPSLALCERSAPEAQKEKCKAVVMGTLEDIDHKCEGFLKQLSACQESGGRGNTCGIAKSNYQGCANSIVKSALADNDIDVSKS